MPNSLVMIIPDRCCRRIRIGLRVAIQHFDLRILVPRQYRDPYPCDVFSCCRVISFNFMIQLIPVKVGKYNIIAVGIINIAPVGRIFQAGIRMVDEHRKVDQVFIPGNLVMINGNGFFISIAERRKRTGNKQAGRP